MLMVDQWEIVVAETARNRRNPEVWALLLNELRRGKRICVREWARQHGLRRSTLCSWLDVIQASRELTEYIPLVKDCEERYVLLWAVPESEILWELE